MPCGAEAAGGASTLQPPFIAIADIIFFMVHHLLFESSNNVQNTLVGYVRALSLACHTAARNGNAFIHSPVKTQTFVVEISDSTPTPPRPSSPPLFYSHASFLLSILATISTPTETDAAAAAAGGEAAAPAVEPETVIRAIIDTKVSHPVFSLRRSWPFPTRAKKRGEYN